MKENDADNDAKSFVLDTFPILICHLDWLKAISLRVCIYVTKIYVYPMCSCTVMYVCMYVCMYVVNSNKDLCVRCSSYSV